MMILLLNVKQYLPPKVLKVPPQLLTHLMQPLEVKLLMKVDKDVEGLERSKN